MSFLASKTKSALNVPSVRDQEYMDTSKFYYDYSCLNDKGLEKFLINCTVEIRGRIYKSLREVYKIGNLLNEVKEKIGYGNYRDWLQKEFIDTKIFKISTAENYQAVANAVNKFGYDKLKYFAVSALYIAGKSRDAIDEEFQQYIFDLGQESYVETGKAVTRQEVLDEKKRFKVIKESALDEQQKQGLIEAKIPIEVINHIVKHKEPEKQKELADNILGIELNVCVIDSNGPDVVTPTSQITKKVDKPVIGVMNIDSKEEQLNELVSIEYLDYDIEKLPSNLDDKVIDVALVQHSVDREGGDLNALINNLSKVTEIIIVITLPMDVFSLKIPHGYTLKNLVYARRSRHRLWNDLSLINHLLCISVIVKGSIKSKKSIDDYFDSIDYAIESVLLSFNYSTNYIYVTRTNSNLISYDIFTPNLLNKLSEKCVNTFLVSK